MLLAQQSFWNFRIFVRGTHLQCGLSQTCIRFIPNLHLVYPKLPFELSQTSRYPELRFGLSQTQVRSFLNQFSACNIKNVREKGARRFFRHITDLFLAVRAGARETKAFGDRKWLLRWDRRLRENEHNRPKAT